MNLDHLNEFVHLAQSLSFRRTAEHFYVSRSVISRHLSALEESLGTVLLDRSTHGVELTEAGEAFLEEARALLCRWEQARERVQVLAGSGDTLVRIGYLRNGARPFLVRFVKHMTEHHPEVHLSLQCMGYHEARQAMEEHSIDVMLGINVARSLSKNYRSTLIYEDRFVVACSRTHPLAQREGGITFDDLREQKVIVPASYVSAGLGSVVAELVDEGALSEYEGLYQDMDLLYLKVQTEECAAFVSNMNAVMFDGPLAIIPIRDLDTSFTMSAYYHDGFTGSLYELCRDGLEECRRALANEAPELFCWRGVPGQCAPTEPSPQRAGVGEIQ